MPNPILTPQQYQSNPSAYWPLRDPITGYPAMNDQGYYVYGNSGYPQTWWSTQDFSSPGTPPQAFSEPTPIPGNFGMWSDSPWDFTGTPVSPWAEPTPIPSPGGIEASGYPGMFGTDQTGQPSIGSGYDQVYPQGSFGSTVEPTPIPGNDFSQIPFDPGSGLGTGSSVQGDFTQDPWAQMQSWMSQYGGYDQSQYQQYTPYTDFSDSWTGSSSTGILMSPYDPSYAYGGGGQMSQYDPNYQYGAVGVDAGLGLPPAGNQSGWYAGVADQGIPTDSFPVEPGSIQPDPSIPPSDWAGGMPPLNAPPDMPVIPADQQQPTTPTSGPMSSYDPSFPYGATGTPAGFPLGYTPFGGGSQAGFGGYGTSGGLGMQTSWTASPASTYGGQLSSQAQFSMDPNQQGDIYTGTGGEAMDASGRPIYGYYGGGAPWAAPRAIYNPNFNWALHPNAFQFFGGMSDPTATQAYGSQAPSARDIGSGGKSGK